MNKKGFVLGIDTYFWSIPVFIIILFIFLSYNSDYTTEHYPDEEVKLNSSLVSCGDDKLIQEGGCCNWSWNYCERYWFPLHAWRNSQATRDFQEYRWWFEDD